MRTWQKLRADLQVLPRARRNRTDAIKWLISRPALLTAVFGYESALIVSSRTENRLKLLAQVRTSSLVGCPF